MLLDSSLEAFREDLELARCLGPKSVEDLGGLLLEPFDEFRTQSGVPDLMVWSEDQAIWFFAEVKGPGDYMRRSQVAWLESAWDKIKGRFALVLMHEA